MLKYFCIDDDLILCKQTTQPSPKLSNDQPMVAPTFVFQFLISLLFTKLEKGVLHVCKIA